MNEWQKITFENKWNIAIYNIHLVLVFLYLYITFCERTLTIVLQILHCLQYIIQCGYAITAIIRYNTLLVKYSI